MIARPFRVTHPNCHPVELSYKYPLINIEKTYGETVKGLLAEGPIVLIEHDTDPSYDLVDWLLHNGGADVLAARYLLYPVTTGLDAPVCAHRSRMGEWLVEEGLCEVQYFGLGCTYLPHGVGDLIDPAWDYPALDWLISQAWLDAGGKAYAIPDWAEHHHR